MATTLLDPSISAHGPRAVLNDSFATITPPAAGRATCNATVAIDAESFAIGEALLKSILLEVSCYPKPGLVTPLSSGSHDDMNLQTFILSSAAIAPCFYQCAQLGRQHGDDLAGLLSRVRAVGITYENHLLAVTNQVNTQRGILFSASVLCAAAGYLSMRGGILAYTQLGEVVSAICQGLCERDFGQLKYRKPETAGEILFDRFGTSGIRGEAESGFRTVLSAGLPALEAAFGQGLGIRHALVQCLLALMGECDDTTVLWRAGREDLADLQNRAREAVRQGGVLTERGQQLIADLDTHCLQKRISPGGSADLLALTTGFYLLKNKAFSVGVM